MPTRPIPPANLELLPATAEQAPILANLFELYAHDFSEFYDVELGPDGRFGYTPLPLYWTEPARHPFLLRIDGAWAGFVLMKRGSEATGHADVWDMAEFCILRAYRRRRIGTHVAHQLWRKFPGPWEVRVLQSNLSAHKFWAHAIAQFTGHLVQPASLQHDGDDWSLYSFDSNPEL